MKKYIFQIIISALTLTLGFSMYLLYSKKSIQDTPVSQSLAETPIDIIELKNQEKELNSTLPSYIPKKVSQKEVNEKLTDLKEMMSKTQDMLKNYNQNNSKIIIKDSDIDKLVSLDLKNSVSLPSAPGETIDEKTQVEEVKADELTAESTQTATASGLNSFVTTSSLVSSSSSSSSTSTTTSSSASTNITTTDSTTPLVVQTEVAKLQTQIDEVKKIITEVSEDVNQ